MLDQNVNELSIKHRYALGWHEVTRSICAGIVAGIPSAVLSRPVLVIITPMHVEMKQGVGHVAKTIYQVYGWRGFMNGLTPSLIASVPGTPLMYTGTYITTELLGYSPSAILLSGYIGMALGCIAYVPPTIINQAKQTLGVNSVIQGSNHITVARKLYQQKGLAGFYAGYWLQIASFGTCNALGLFFASTILETMHSHGYNGNTIACSAYILGYALAGTLTNPLELIKRQRQAAWTNPSRFPDKSALEIVQRITKQHGVSSLYRGAHVYGFWAATRFGSAYATGDIIKRESLNIL
jgi:hypothetical protein